MSIATIDEPASCDDVTMNELSIIAPANPVETIKAEFVPTADLEENQSNDLIELTNATSHDLASVTNNYQLLTNASIEHESLTNVTNATTYDPHSFDSLEPSTSGDYQLIIPSDDHHEPANVAVDQQPLTNDVQPATNVGDNCQLPTSESADIVNTQPPVDTAKNGKPPASQPVSVVKSKSDTTPPRSWQIPPHLFGRDLNNPDEDLPGPNKRILKPRPGVKVPYRNLTSQIVSRSELAQEILERQKRKNLYTDGLDSGDMFFAMKLTHRLANKISSNESADKKSPEAVKSVTTTAASVIVPTSSDSVPKTVSAKSAENSSTKPVSVIANTNVVVKPSTPKAATAITNASPATITTNTIIQPTSSTGAKLRLTPDSSGADELYAEISSTLNEDYDPTATPVQIFSAEQLQPQSKTKTSNIVNGSIRTEAELDNDTLLAILEGTTDEKELSPTTNTAPTTPQSAIIATSTPIPKLSEKDKKRRRLIIDPSQAKELALKQLMDFERKPKDKNVKVTAAVKAKVAAKPACPQNGVLIPATNTTVAAITEAEPKVTVAGSPKKTIKRSNISYKVGSQAPKRFPKKYQRIIKQQLRSSKKQKTKNKSSPVQQPQQQKKLPEVPEVQIAIDRFIKTYTSKKRKLKSDHQNTETPAEKKMKMDATVPNAADVPVANEGSATANEEAADMNEKTAGVVANSDIIAKAPVVAEEATSEVVVARQKVNVARQKANVTRKKAIVRKKAAANSKTVVAKPAAVDEKATSSVAAAPVPVQPSLPADPPIEVPEKVVVDEQNEIPEEEDSELEENDSEEALAQSKGNMKVMREINRLLGDEGAINMIYSVERKRIPGGKSDANVQPSVRRTRDLQLRTKLVKNAVLRLSMSSSSQGTPTRNVRRLLPDTSLDGTPGTSPLARGATALRKVSIDSVDSTMSELNNNSSCSSTPARGTKTRHLAAEASRIIRRHSSSSAYSSDDDEEAAKKGATVGEESTLPNKSPLRESSEASVTGEMVVADAPSQVATEECVPPKASVETAVAEKKESRRSSDGSKTKSLSSSRRSSKEASASAVANEIPVLQDSALNGSLGSELFEQHLSLKEITVRKYDNLVQIILISSSTKMKNVLNIDILRELISVLRELEKDDSCRTVLVTSTGSSFCQGIDLQALISADKTERTKIVNEFVNTLMSFTKCLSQFRKILIAGVQGSAVGLGVTMLPFFDMVFASDKATFYTPYVKLGQIPEAGATLTLPHLLGNAVTSDLLFGCRMLTASEALQFGLVTRILWPDKFTEELLPLARGISSHSSRAMEATKLLLRQGMTAQLEEQFETEAKLLREHWCSEECQSSFKNYLDQEALLQNN